MSTVVTGATGHLGRLVVQALLARGVPAEQIVAAGRRTDALADLAERGVAVRRAEYDEEASLREAFTGAEKVLLVSGSEVGQRVRQHGNAIRAAKAARRRGRGRPHPDRLRRRAFVRCGTAGAHGAGASPPC